MNRSLTRKILTVVIILIIICTASFTLVSYLEIQKAVTGQMKSDGTTLIISIKREIKNENVSDVKELQNIFKAIKDESNGNISYISLSDENSNIIVSDNSINSDGVDSLTDGISSATSKGDVADVVSQQDTIGQIIDTSNGEKVYNISTNYTYGENQSGALNVGISLQEMNLEISHSLMKTIYLSVFIMLLTIIIGTIMARYMIRPIAMISKRLQMFSEGDFRLGYEHYSKDEIGQMSVALNQMRETLSEMVGNIQYNAHKVMKSSLKLTSVLEEVATTEEGISASSEELAVGSADLASNSEDGLERLNRLASEIVDLFQRTDSMKESMQQTREAKQTGISCMNELQLSIEDNTIASNKIKEQIDILTLKAESITEITTIIKNISAKTKLLALNAGIESARAGEHGKGFAVVADEIGKLSQQTANSIAGIEEIVKEVNIAMTETQEYMLKGHQALNKTASASSNTGDAFETIESCITHIIQEIQVLMEGITKINNDKNGVVDMIQGIAAISQQSTASIEEISSSLEQQSSNMESVSQSAHELQAVAAELDQLVVKIKTK